MKKGVDYIGVAVGAIIINEKGEIFITKRGNKAQNERGYWEVPGGSVEFGESLEDAIKREMKEEYDIEIEVLEQLPANNHFIPDEKQHWVPTCFIAKLKPGQNPHIMEPEKCDEIGWFPLDKLPSPLSIITSIDVNRFRKQIENVIRNGNINAGKPGVDFIGITVSFFCYDKYGNLLLHKRSIACRDEQDRWDCGGGVIEFGESFEQAARRELMEEYCIKPDEKDIHLCGVHNVLRSNGKKKTHWVAIIYAVKVRKPETVKIGEPDSMSEIGWFSINKLPYPLHSMLLTHLDFVKQYLPNK